MNPFEKRDKIPRTPPGQSFLDRSSLMMDNSLGNASLYFDESGIRSFQIPSDVKRYTLTFDPNKDGRVSYPRDSGWSINQATHLLTSSPFRGSNPCPSMNGISNVAAQNVSIVSDATDDKENQPELVTPAPQTVKRRRRPKTRTDSSTDSTTSSGSNDSWSSGRLRPRHNPDNSLVQTKRKMNQKTVSNELDDSVVPSTRSRGRRRRRLSPTRPLETPHQPLNVTPSTVVPKAKPPPRVGSDVPITVVKRRGEVVCPTTTPVKSLDLSPDVPKTVVRARPRRRPNPDDSTVTVDQSSSNFEGPSSSTEQPIARRLRSNAAQISYCETAKKRSRRGH